ncbi:MAG TPA: hypothetical protein VMW47_06555 [Verrucomicrobiae bacterium]|nr:hypothetical protein [Verrucomicrobiae bacterium]
MITTEQAQRVADRSRCLKVADEHYEYQDFGFALNSTVIDFMLPTAAVRKALAHYTDHCQAAIPTLASLESLLLEYHDNDKIGNSALAQHLWGYNLWTRAGLLRRLAAFCHDPSRSDLPSLREWSKAADFKKDFAGQVQYLAPPMKRRMGLGPAVFAWLCMCLGDENRVKPDVQVVRFVKDALGHDVTESDAAALVAKAAPLLKLSPRDLDWRIWEYQIAAADGKGDARIVCAGQVAPSGSATRCDLAGAADTCLLSGVD